MTQHDIIIIGGGLVGAGLAVALRDTELNIALVDAKLPASNDVRLFALNAGSCQFLENLGLWSQLAKHATPIHQVHVSHQGHFGSVRLKREDVGLPALGYVIPAYHIEVALNAALLTVANCTLYRPATLQTIQQQNNIATLTLQTDKGEMQLQSGLMIGADGTESTVRKQLGIQTQVFDYQQSAIVTRTRLQRFHQHIAYERFERDGAIAMLPLSENECATIWSLQNEKASRLMALSDVEFVAELQQTFGYKLGKFQGITTRHMFPLRMVKAEKAIEQCVFLLGNSAHTLHPIAAQGFNLALYEVATLVEAMLAKKVFTADDLQKVYADTEQRQATSMGVSHRLSRLFSGDSFAYGLVAQLGMLGLNIATPLRRRFMQGMLGRTGRVPRLLLANES